MDVWGGIRVKGEDVVGVEDVVGGGVFGEMGIFEGRNRKGVREFLEVVGWDMGVVLWEERGWRLEGLMEEMGEFECRRGGGFEGFGVFREDDGEDVVLEG